MAPIASRSIWLDRFPDLVSRWFHRQPEALKTELISPRNVQERVERRVHRMLEIGKLTPRYIPQSVREWETKWQIRVYWKEIVAKLNEVNCDVIRHDTQSTDHDVSMSALHESERDSLVLVEEALETITEFCRSEGLDIPLTTNDVALIACAREYYTRLAQRAGNAPRPWVDEIAAPTFAQYAFGFPFNPLVIELLEAEKQKAQQ
ncbi:MAG: hypothetical protein ACFCU1_04325 [Sumerlaeia bacterium]